MGDDRYPRLSGGRIPNVFLKFIGLVTLRWTTFEANLRADFLRRVASEGMSAVIPAFSAGGSVG
jgi:hypothetical protein